MITSNRHVKYSQKASLFINKYILKFYLEYFLTFNDLYHISCGQLMVEFRKQLLEKYGKE